MASDRNVARSMLTSVRCLPGGEQVLGLRSFDGAVQ
jgi:hypothetical protein